MPDQSPLRSTSGDELFPDPLLDQAARLLQLCRTARLRLTTAESCTGGLVAGLLTAIPGSSDVVERAFVTYSNEAKAEMLGVPASLIEAKGAVSAEVALAMAQGALAHARADLAVAVTGVAGPGGGSAEKPVGLVHFATARVGGATVHEEHRFGPLTRDAIRMRSVETALAMLKRAATTRA